MSDTESTTSAARLGTPSPRAVRAAVAILGLLAVSDVASLVLGLVVAPASGGDVAAGIVVTVARVAISLVLARLLWRGSNTGRVLIIVRDLITVVFFSVSTAVDGLGPVDLYLAWTLAELLLVVVLLGLMFVPETRRWVETTPR